MSYSLERIARLRAEIKASIKTGAMLWDDTRPSQDISHKIPGMPVGLRITVLTPDSMRAAEASPEKARVMGHFADAIGAVGFTPIGRDRLIRAISGVYNVALTSDDLLGILGVDLKRDRLGMVEPTQVRDHEASMIEVDTRRAFLAIFGIVYDGVPIRIPADRLGRIRIVDLTSMVETMPQGLIQNIHRMTKVRPDMHGVIEEMGVITTWAQLFETQHGDTRFASAVPVMQRFIPPTPRA